MAANDSIEESVPDKPIWLPDRPVSADALQQADPTSSPLDNTEKVALGPRPGQLEPTDVIEPEEVTEFEEQPAAVTDFIDTEAYGTVSRCPHLFRHPLRASGWFLRTGFGIVSLILMLAVVAAIPIVNFLALGYLLEVEGRVGRTGKLRRAFPLLNLAPRLGSIALGVGLWLLPLRLLAGAVVDARLIDPGGAAARNLKLATIFAAGVIAVHLCLALARGGSLGCFFRPLKNVLWLIGQLREGHYLEHAAGHVREFVVGLHLKHHFSLGMRGYIAAALWLWIPTAFFAAADSTRGGPIAVTVFGGLCLIPVLSVVPFLQARFAAENRFRAMFEVRRVIGLFTRAPFIWLIAVVLAFVLSFPLYLLTVVLPPQDAMWLVTIVFIVSIYPAKVIVGWAYGRAVRKPAPTDTGGVWLFRRVVLPLSVYIGAIVPLLGAYIFLLFFTQAIGAHGKAVLFEHHVFLLPVPF